MEVPLSAFCFIYHLLPKQGSCWDMGSRQQGDHLSFSKCVGGKERPGVCHRIKVEKHCKREASLHHRMPDCILRFSDPVWFTVTSSCDLLLNRPSLCFREQLLRLDNTGQTPENLACGSQLSMCPVD